MGSEVLAIKFLGTSSILLIVGFILCFLASLGYTAFLKFHNKDKKIEVHTENSNSKNIDN